MGRHDHFLLRVQNTEKMKKDAQAVKLVASMEVSPGSGIEHEQSLVMR